MKLALIIIKLYFEWNWKEWDLILSLEIRASSYISAKLYKKQIAAVSSWNEHYRQQHSDDFYSFLHTNYNLQGQSF